LTFGTPKLIRNFTAAASLKLDIVEIDLPLLLSELHLTMDEFVDLCILMGCDYTNTIRGIGPQKALEMIQKYHSIEEGIKSLDKEKHPVDDTFLYREAGELFRSPEVMDTKDLKLVWEAPDEDGLLAFLCDEKGFGRERVLAGVERIKKSRAKSTQQRLESFFTPIPLSEQDLDRKRKASASQKTPTKKPRGKK